MTVQAATKGMTESFVRECRSRLANAERRIEILMKDQDGELIAGELATDDL